MISHIGNYELLLIVINSITAIKLLCTVINVTNQMNAATLLTARVAVILIGIGSFGALLAPFLLTRLPTYAEMFLLTGTSILLHCKSSTLGCITDSASYKKST